MKTQGEIEAAICEGVSRFEQDYMGRGPKDIRAHLLGDLLVVRLQGVLTAAEQHLVKSLPAEKGRDLLKQVRTHLIETARPVMEAMIQEITGVKVLTMHHDISTRDRREGYSFHPCRVAHSPRRKEEIVVLKRSCWLGVVLNDLRRKTVKRLKPYGILYIRNQCSRHTQRPDPGSQQAGHDINPAGKLSAKRHGNVTGFLDHQLDEPQNSRMVVREILGNHGILSPGGHGVLGEIIRADAEKVHVLLQRRDGQCGCRRFDHRTDTWQLINAHFSGQRMQPPAT